MHLVTGGGDKQLAGMMMQAEADLDELIVAYSQVSCSHFLTATLAIALSESLPFHTTGNNEFVPVLDACHQAGHEVPDQTCMTSAFIAAVVI